MGNRTVLGWLFVAALALSACANQPIEGGAPPVQQPVPPGTQAWYAPQPVAPGQDGTYVPQIGVNQDVHIYDLTGVVQAAPGSNTTYSASGSFSGYGNGYSSGYMEAGTTGKGIVKFLITGIKITNPYQAHGFPDKGYEPLAAVGEVRALKTVDAAAKALAPGETVTFRCRLDKDFMPPVGILEQPAIEGVTLSSITAELFPPLQAGRSSAVPAS